MAVDIKKHGDFYNVVWIAWPQALGFLVMTVQSMVDMFWIGRLGTEAVAAVGLVGNIVNVVFGVSGFLHVGSVAVMARALGAGEKVEASRVLAHSFLLGLATGVLILVMGLVMASPAVAFFGVEPEVADLAVVYLKVMSAHLMIVYFIIPLGAAFTSAGDTFIPLILNTIAVLVNVVLDPVFIFAPGDAVEIAGAVIHPGVLGMGVFGAGLASVVAAGAGMALYFGVGLIGLFPVLVPLPGRVRLEWFEAWRIIKIGVPFALAHISRPLSTILLLRIIADFGTGPVAGFGISMRWYSVNWILIGGMGTAVATLVGQYLGASSPHDASRVSRRVIIAGLVFQVITTFLYFVLAPAMVAMMDPNPETVGPGADFMRWVVAGFLLSTPGGLAAAAMNGAGETVPGMVAGVVSNWFIKLPLAWLLSLVPWLGLDGVWVGMFISLLAEGAICFIWYGRGGWREKVLSRDGGTGV